MLATLALSCTKTELAETAEVENLANEYGMIISVSGQNSLEPQTKALKTSWADGDKIYLFTEDTGTGYFTLTYNAGDGKWTVVKNGTIDESFMTSGTGAASDKKVLAFHVPFDEITPTFSSGSWTLPTGDVYYTYDNNVRITHVNGKGHYVKVQITLKAPTNFVQIYVNKERINEYTPSGGSTLTCNNLAKLQSISVSSSLEHGFQSSQTTGTYITGRLLTAGGETGTVFYGMARTGQDATTEFTLVSGAVEYTYSKNAQLEAKAYNMSGTGWTTLLLLSGRFAVSSTQYVRFTPGNLQANYNGGTPQWRFAKEQYDIIGTQDISKYKTASGGKYPWYDLFGWGATGQAASGKTAVPFWTVGGTTGSATQQAEFRSDKNSANTSLTTSDDWGANVIEGAASKTYGTLTKTQWDYLFSNYTPKASKIVVSSTRTVNGMVIQPNGTPKTSYTLAEWRTAEQKNGAVFFPSAGFRNGETSESHNEVVNSSNDGFFYWSRTLSNEKGSQQTTYYLPWGFGIYGSTPPSYMMINWRSTGRAVRLVKVFNNE